MSCGVVVANISGYVVVLLAVLCAPAPAVAHNTQANICYHNVA